MSSKQPAPIVVTDAGTANGEVRVTDTETGTNMVVPNTVADVAQAIKDVNAK